jgi:hypothetical protein
MANLFYSFYNLGFLFNSHKGVTMDVKKLADSIVKEAIDISQVDPKIQNRIMEVKKIYQKIKVVQDTIDAQVADLNKQIKDMEKQTKIFEKEILPVLKTLEDHAIQAEGIFLELKAGKRSPKVGYEFLASHVESSLMSAAEEAITKAAEFAKGMTVTVSSKSHPTKYSFSLKNAGIVQWMKDRWESLVNFVHTLKKKVTEAGDAIDQLAKETAERINEIDKAHGGF